MSITERVLEKVAEVVEQYVVMSTKFEALEKSFDKLIENQQQFIDRMAEDYRDLDRRITAIEGTLASTFQTSLKEAIIQLAREHLEKHGSLEGFSPDLIGEEEQIFPPSSPQSP